MKKEKSKKKQQSQKMLVSFLLDETGSMEMCRDQTISGFNEYIQNLKDKKEDVRFTFIKFNSEKTETVHEAVELEKVKKLNRNTFQPDAVTPLYDAIGDSINGIDKTERNLLFVVMTDGYENASRRFTQKQIFDLIKEKEKMGWTFVYLGANQDSWAATANLGLAAGNVSNYNTAKTGDVFKNLSKGTSVRNAQVKVGVVETRTFYSDAGIKDEDMN